MEVFMFSRLSAASLAFAATTGILSLACSGRAQASCVWSVVPSVNAVTDGNRLYGVSAASPLDAWAVGVDVRGGANDTLAERWDGKRWSLATTPNGAGNDSELQAVKTLAPNNAWAVGYYYKAAAGIYQTLIEHWNGSAWAIVPSPTAGKFGGALLGVDAVSANDIWAGGSGTAGGGA